MKKIKLLCLTTLLVLSSHAIAESAPDDAIKYRKALMNTVKNTINALGATLKGEVDQADQIPELAAAVAAATNSKMTIAGFKQNTDGQGDEKTTATAKVWSEWDDFSEAFEKLGKAGQEIQTLADAGELTSFDQLKPALANCGYCHRKAGYRTK